MAQKDLFIYKDEKGRFESDDNHLTDTSKNSHEYFERHYGTVEELSAEMHGSEAGMRSNLEKIDLSEPGISEGYAGIAEMPSNNITNASDSRMLQFAGGTAGTVVSSVSQAGKRISNKYNRVIESQSFGRDTQQQEDTSGNSKSGSGGNKVKNLQRLLRDKSENSFDNLSAKSGRSVKLKSENTSNKVLGEQAKGNSEFSNYTGGLKDASSKTAASTAGKEATGVVVKETGKQAVGEVAKEVGKQAAAEVAKEGAVAAAGAASGAATAGVGTAITIAMKVKEKAEESAKKKIREVTDTGFGNDSDKKDALTGSKSDKKSGGFGAMFGICGCCGCALIPVIGLVVIILLGSIIPSFQSASLSRGGFSLISWIRSMFEPEFDAYAELGEGIEYFTKQQFAFLKLDIGGNGNPDYYDVNIDRFSPEAIAELYGIELAPGKNEIIDKDEWFVRYELSCCTTALASHHCKLEGSKEIKRVKCIGWCGGSGMGFLEGYRKSLEQVYFASVAKILYGDEMTVEQYEKFADYWNSEMRDEENLLAGGIWRVQDGFYCSAISCDGKPAWQEYFHSGHSGYIINHPAEPCEFYPKDADLTRMSIENGTIVLGSPYNGDGWKTCIEEHDKTKFYFNAYVTISQINYVEWSHLVIRDHYGYTQEAEDMIELLEELTIEEWGLSQLFDAPIKDKMWEDRLDTRYSYSINRHFYKTSANDWRPGGSAFGYRHLTDEVFKFWIKSKIWGDVEPFNNYPSRHNGLDIPCPEDTKVYAIAPGVVTEIEYSESSGLVLTYECADIPYMMYRDEDGSSQKAVIQVSYHHLNAVAPGVEVGKTFRSGDFLALSGNTGTNSFGPHLHIGIRRLGARGGQDRPYVPIFVLGYW